MKWYLKQAYSLQSNQKIKDDISSLIESIEYQTLFNVESLISIDLEIQRTTVNKLLRNTSNLVRIKAQKSVGKLDELRNSRRADYIGLDLRKSDLRGADSRGACLIAANLSGLELDSADMRDTNLKGANLRNSLFLTQAQINSGQGHSQTMLPDILDRPNHWRKYYR